MSIGRGGDLSPSASSVGFGDTSGSGLLRKVLLSPRGSSGGAGRGTDGSGSGRGPGLERPSASRMAWTSHPEDAVSSAAAASAPSETMGRRKNTSKFLPGLVEAEPPEYSSGGSGSGSGAASLLKGAKFAGSMKDPSAAGAKPKSFRDISKHSLVNSNSFRDVSKR